MKSILLFYLICLIGLYVPNAVNQHSGLTPNQEIEIKENFIQFLEEFSLDDKFQLSRIKFPLLFICLNESFADMDTSYIELTEWKPRYFCFGPDQTSFYQIYDNFQHKLRDTDERVFAWHGIGNGIKNFLYFKRIDGRWFLVKEEDFST